MSAALYRIEPLAKKHDRTSFQCGSSPLETYFQKQVSQDMRRRFGKCFVAVDVDTERVSGFYTMSASSLALSALPDKFCKRLPRYPLIPVVLIGRLAVDIRAQGQGLGSSLIIDAVRRVAPNDIGVFAIVVDAKDASACAFYKRHGFTPIKGDENRLVLSVDAALKAFGSGS